jgi:hypothetical protein
MNKSYNISIDNPSGAKSSSDDYIARIRLRESSSMIASDIPSDA